MKKVESIIERAEAKKAGTKRKAIAPRRWNNLVKSQDEQYQLKRQAVIAEASRAFGHRGYQNVSLDEIAKSLNVTKPALYHYFKSKQELLYECHNLSMEIGDMALEEAMTTGKNGLEKLENFVSIYIRDFASELGASAVLHEYSGMTPKDRKQIMARRRQFDLRLRDLIQEGIDDKTIAECNPKLAVFWFMGAITSIPRWYRLDGDLSGADIAQTFVHFLVKGIQGQGLFDGGECST
ncbi:TetR/AcrR family transcriptional regulator [Alcaligenes sp. Me129]|uniref:TetR/AcrR family transcriptional regulator n=1 Tax=Alcaligenes sp. Me129 TaxID=3392635 RepID=UPI003D23793C